MVAISSWLLFLRFVAWRPAAAVVAVVASAWVVATGAVGPTGDPSENERLRGTSRAIVGLTSTALVVILSRGEWLWMLLGLGSIVCTLIAVAVVRPRGRDRWIAWPLLVAGTVVWFQSCDWVGPIRFRDELTKSEMDGELTILGPRMERAATRAFATRRDAEAVMPPPPWPKDPQVLRSPSGDVAAAWTREEGIPFKAWGYVYDPSRSIERGVELETTMWPIQRRTCAPMKRRAWWYCRVY